MGAALKTRYLIAWDQWLAALCRGDFRRADYWRSILTALREEVG